jgi:hypothetical protein
MKRIAYIVPTVIAVALAACAPAPRAMSFDGPDGELPELARLALGTLELEGTRHAVGAGQAAELLTLWQVYQSLSASDTAATAEVEALDQQIRESMSAEQLQAIQDMQLTMDDMFAFMQEHGLVMAGPDLSPEQIATAQAAGGGEGAPDVVFIGPAGGGGGGEFFVGPGGGPGQGPAGGSLSSEQIATAQAVRSAAGGAGLPRVAPPLLNALIEYLQERAAAQ